MFIHVDAGMVENLLRERHSLDQQLQEARQALANASAQVAAPAAPASPAPPHIMPEDDTMGLLGLGSPIELPPTASVPPLVADTAQLEQELADVRMQLQGEQVKCLWKSCQMCCLLLLAWATILPSWGQICVATMCTIVT